MWALGILLFKMLTGSYPFVSKKNKSLMKEIIQNEIEYPPTMKLKHVVLLKKMLKKEPHQRISTHELLKYLRKM